MSSPITLLEKWEWGNGMRCDSAVISVGLSFCMSVILPCWCNSSTLYLFFVNMAPECKSAICSSYDAQAQEVETLEYLNSASKSGEIYRQFETIQRRV